MPYKNPLTPEQHRALSERKKRWWANLPEEKRQEIREKKSITYWENRKKVSYNYKGKGDAHQTLCWDCQRAVKECPWAANFEPVDGWDAEPTVIMSTYCPQNSYHVKACPLFEPDP